jgi:hypothetical protein
MGICGHSGQKRKKAQPIVSRLRLNQEQTRSKDITDSLFQTSLGQT